MKKLLVLPLSALLLAMAGGCQKVNELTEFDIDYSTTMPVAVSALSLDTTVDLVSPEIPTETAGHFARNETTRDLIDEIVLTRFKITNQSGGNLDFLKSLSIYVKAPNLADLLVATRANIPAGSTTVDADLTKANIREHLFKEKIQFRVVVSINKKPATDESFRLEQTVHVKGKKIK